MSRRPNSLGVTMLKKAAFVALAVAGAGIIAASPASAAQQCGDLGSGGEITFCKSWNWDGNDYDGKWWTSGPSSLPSYTYLQRSEDGHVTNSAFSGSYHDVKKLAFRLCDSLSGHCNSWW
jgi:hypothetical protein